MTERESVISFFIKLFEDFSLKRLLITVLALTALIIVVLIYERYTSNFELNRVQKSAEILAVLNKINVGPSHANDEVKIIKGELLRDLRQIVDQKPPTIGILDSIRVGVASAKVKQFLSGAALWLILLLIALPKSFKNTPSNIPRLLIFALFSFVSGWLAIIMDLKLSALSTSLVYFLVPLGILFIIGIILGIAIPQFAAYRMAGYNAEALSILKNTRTTLESYFANNGIYPSILNETGIHTSPTQVNLEFKLINQDKYLLSSTHDKGNKVYIVSSETNEIITKDKKAKSSTEEKSSPEIKLASD